MKPEDKKYSEHGMREGNPGDINPNDIDHKHPAKTISGKSDSGSNESQSGNDDSYRPAEEQINEGFTNIGDEQTAQKSLDTDDFKRVDERDNHDSTEEWDAEKSRTGRHK